MLNILKLVFDFKNKYFEKAFTIFLKYLFKYLKSFWILLLKYLTRHDYSTEILETS